MVALIRIVELVSGFIGIDDVDISKLGLNDIRNAISIIPQDAILCAWKLTKCVGALTSILSPELCGPTWILLDNTMTHGSGTHLGALTLLIALNLSALWNPNLMAGRSGLEQEPRHHRTHRALL